ncbi:hypothetical protein BZA70DRAFT_272705 [Myxozyma melibiosi]|uniref:SAGA-associated factor 11 n=1 Tax=Myxozyma melibiosi TaxID=54550 RepID=A0ABR1FE31_9ASCO
MASQKPQINEINVPLMSLSLLEDLLQPLTHDIFLTAFTREKRSRLPCPSCGAIHNSRASPAAQSALGKGNYVNKPGLDIYGQPKQQASDPNSYYECSNCARKIAVSRYAAHLERCLSGRSTRTRNAANSNSGTQSVASPMSMSPSSPYVTEDEPSTPKPATKKRKIANAKHSHAKSGKTLPTSHMSDGAYSDSGSTITVNGRLAHRDSKRKGDKTLPGRTSPQKSQVSKFLDRAGSPLTLYSSDSSDTEVRKFPLSTSSPKGVKVEQISDSD